MRYQDLQARVYKQETSNLALLTLTVFNFEFLVCKQVIVNADNVRTKSVLKVLIFSLSKPLEYTHFNNRVKILKLYLNINKNCTLYYEDI